MVDSAGPDKPHTFFKNPLATLRACKVVEVACDRQFLHGHLREVYRHDLQAVQPPPPPASEQRGTIQRNQVVT